MPSDTVSINILRCKWCGVLTVEIGHHAACPKGHAGWFDTIAERRVPREWVEQAIEVHGKTCRKAPHVGGDLHEEDWDKPYDVDGVLYCGRCHLWLSAEEAKGC